MLAGLYFAGSDDGSYGVANPIQDVLDALNVEICVPMIKKLEPKELQKETIKEKFERKETKREWKEFWPDKRWKEILKEIREPKGFREDWPWQPWEEIPSAAPQAVPAAAATVEERLGQLEAALSQMGGLVPSKGGAACVDFRALVAGAYPNPNTFQGVKITAYDWQHNPAGAIQIRTMGGLQGLNCNWELEITLPTPATAAELTLVQFARPCVVTALDAAGAVVGTATMSGAQGVAETLRIAGAGITAVRVKAPQDEALLLLLCYEGGRVKIEKVEKREKLEKREKPEKREKLEKPEKFEKPEKLEKREWKDIHKEFKEPKELKDIREVGPLAPEAGAPGSVEERLARIEAAIAQMTHFIPPEDRPDLTTGALSQEQDLLKREVDTKGYKDAEKLTEGGY